MNPYLEGTVLCPGVHREILGPHRSAGPALVLVLALLASSAAGAEPSPSRVDFLRHVRPLLAERCFPCHGPDEKARKADLRLDTREGLFEDRDVGKVVVPSQPEESEIYRRITHENERRRMPPRSSTLSLAPGEVDLLRRWIAEGAEWTVHWSFRPVVAPRLPHVRRAEWAREPLDRFILDRLEHEGLDPAPETSRERWLRRVSLDLTGLPPAIEEIDAFLADDSPVAPAKAADRLLASPAFGERMAAEWLDVARFGDTYGYQADRFNHLWPWRDWVIDAFNRGLPYDQFITWQLAGDLLPGATREQRLATAFNRAHRQTNEGGSENEEFRVEYNADRVKTTALAFFGLTIECARCHDHKYDPISQRDYYRFFAFFNSTDESGLYSHFTDSIPCPTLLLYSSDEEERRHADLRARIAAAERGLGAQREEARGRFQAWLDSGAEPGEISGLAAHFSFDEAGGDAVVNSADGSRGGRLNEAPQRTGGREGRAVLFCGDDSVTIDKVGPFRRIDPFSFSLWLRSGSDRSEMVVLHRQKAGSDAGSRGYEMVLEEGRVSFALVHFWPGNALKVRTLEELPRGEWVHVAVTYDGSSRAEGVKVFVGGRAVELEVVRDGLFKDITYGEDVPLTLGARFRGAGFSGGAIDELRVYSRALAPLEVDELSGGRSRGDLLRAARGAAGGVQREDLFSWYLAAVDAPWAAALRDLQGLRAEESRLVESVPEVMVMGDLPEPRPTFVLKRGVYSSPGERVEAGTPASVLEFGPGLPPNRLGLARWLIDPRHPLTARVTVNRYWQLFFGRGLVATAEDLGTQGELPTHPELLDWLAARFVSRGWDLKRLQREVVLSASYRQSTQATPQKLDRDLENRLLSRGPAQRLTAEMIRDLALSAADLVVRRLDGPSVQPGEAVVGAGEESRRKGGRLGYRRSVYTFIKRTASDPFFITFDATSRETCIARRLPTDTPLQSLILLNDDLFADAARALAERAVTHGGGGLDARLRFIFRVLVGRDAGAAERQVVQRLFDEQRALFAADPSACEAFLGGGKFRPRGEAVDLAALAVVASTVLNFDEAIFKR
jgi:hypothetical protein